jgi:5-formyltetrahydrofolate cyclo-ligase
MIFIQIHDLSECALSSFGILEPKSNQVYNQTIEVMVIPMLAYNASLHRLGWGLAYYDQYLKNYHGYKLGLCIKMNLEPLLNPSSHDVACDEIISA